MLESLRTAQQLSIHSSSWFLICAIEASLPRATCSKRSGRQQLRAPYQADVSALSGFSSRAELGLVVAGSQQSQGANPIEPSSRRFLSHEFSLNPSTQQKARFQPRQLSSSGWRKAIMSQRTNGQFSRIPMNLSLTSMGMSDDTRTAGAKQLPSLACSIVPIAAARCMSTAPITASAFLNTPAHSTPKFLVGHSARPSTVSMRCGIVPCFRNAESHCRVCKA